MAHRTRYRVVLSTLAHPRRQLGTRSDFIHTNPAALAVITCSLDSEFVSTTAACIRSFRASHATEHLCASQVLHHGAKTSAFGTLPLTRLLLRSARGSAHSAHTLLCLSLSRVIRLLRQQNYTRRTSTAECGPVYIPSAIYQLGLRLHPMVDVLLQLVSPPHYYRSDDPRLRPMCYCAAAYLSTPAL